MKKVQKKEKEKRIPKRKKRVKKKVLKKQTWIFTLILVLLIGTAITLPRVLSQDKDSDEVYTSAFLKESEKILKKEVEVSFGKYAPNGKQDGEYDILYTLTNKTKETKEFGIEFSVKDKRGNRIAHGMIYEKSVPGKKKVSGTATMVLIQGEESDLKNAVFELERAFSNKE